MFEGLKQSLREALNRASSPTEGRAVLATMRDTLIEAKAGIATLQAGTEATRAQLAAERAELAIVQRRGRLAAEVQDAETVRVAAQFERRHAERVGVLEQKLTAQQAELELAERELADMIAELRAASARLGMSDVAAPPSGADRTSAASAPDADLRRATDRMAHEAAAARQLAELKRRMGR